jgi:hypothetical protein
MKAFLLGLAILTTAGGAVAHAQTSPFAGVWKMDPAKSKFTGDTLTYTKTATGFKFSNGGPVAYAFAIDGKDYPIMAGRTTAWTKAGPGAWDVMFKLNGKVMTKAHRVLSADGKTLTSTYVESRADGTSTTEKDVYQRVSGTEGLAGEWKDVKADVADDTMKITVPAPGAFKLEDPTDKVVIVGKTDGSPVSLTGPTIPPGAAATYKAVGPTTWAYTRLLNGKLFSKGELTVLPGGKTLTDSSWIAGKESEKSVAVYVKQ